MSRQMLPLRRQGAGEMVLPSSPSHVTRLCDVSGSADSWCCRNDTVRFLTQQAEWLCSANHGSIGGFSPIALSGCPRGHRVSSRDLGARKHAPPNGIMDTRPRTRASGEPTGIARDKSRESDSPQTLKLLAVSDVRRRNELLSSRPTK